MYQQKPSYTSNIRRSNATSIAELQARVFNSYSDAYLKSICDKGINDLVSHKNESRAVAKHQRIEELLNDSKIKLFFEVANPQQLYFLAGNPHVLKILGEESLPKFLSCGYNTRKRLVKNAVLSLIIRQSDNKDNLMQKLLDDKSPKVKAALYSNRSIIMLIPKERIINELSNGPIQVKVAIASNPSSSLILNRYEIKKHILTSESTEVKIAAAKNMLLMIKSGTDMNILLNDKFSVIMALLSEKNNLAYLNHNELYSLRSKYRKNPLIKHLIYRAIHHTNMARANVYGIRRT